MTVDRNDERRSVPYREAVQSIHETIAREGPIPFDRFMELALYGAGGFFSGDVLRSQKSGDFLTSPEISPLFGKTLAAFVAAEHERIGDPFAILEAGAGSGSLLGPLLATHPVEGWAVEVSPVARDRLGAILGPDRVLDSLESFQAPLRGVIVANELLDNLPMAVAQLTEGGWRERWVGAEGEGLALVDASPRPEVASWLQRFAGPVEPGGWVEVQIAAGRWIARALELIRAGALLVIDYGDTAENLVPRRRDGTLRTYRAHHLGPHPLDEPGATDITADLNFSAAVAAATAAGAEVSVLRQDDFLAQWGLRSALSELRSHELELARSGDEMERLAVRSRRSEAETLLHPRGLGDFRVMVARR